MRNLSVVLVWILTLVSCAKEPESRLNRSASIDDIVPDSFVASSDQSTALTHIDKGLHLIDSDVGEPTVLSLNGADEPNVEAVANDANRLLNKIVRNLQPSDKGYSLSGSDMSETFLNPRPGEQCRDQLESIPKSYSSTISSTKQLIQKMKELGDGNSTSNDKFTIVSSQKGRADSFAYTLKQTDVGVGKQPITLEISGGSDHTGLYTAKIVLTAPSTMTFQYRIFGDSNRKNLKVAAKFNLLKVPDFESDLSSTSSDKKPVSTASMSNVKDLRADFYIRLDLDASQIAKQSFKMTGNFKSLTDSSSVDISANVDSYAEMSDKNHLEARHKVVATGKVSDQKSGTTNVNFDQTANIKYEKGVDENGEFCSINGVKSPIPSKKIDPVVKPARTPSPTMPPEDDRSFNSYTVSSFEAKYFNNGAVVKTEMVDRPSINWAAENALLTKPENVSATWSGKIEVTNRDQIIDFNIDNSWAPTTLKLDGKEIANWSSGPRVLPQNLSVGTHVVEIRFVNTSKVGVKFNASFTRNRVFLKEDLKRKLAGEATGAAKILHAGVKNSSDEGNMVKISLDDHDSPIYVVLTSEHPVHWMIDNPKNVRVLGIIFNSGVAGATISATKGVPIYNLKDLYFDYSDTNRIASDIKQVFGFEPNQMKSIQSASLIVFDK